MPTITTLVNHFIATIRDFDRSAFAVAGGLGPWLTPLAPALVFGHTFYAGTLDDLGRWAGIGGVAMSVGLVVAGATSSHTAMALKSAGAPADKVRGCWALVVAYIILEISGILTMQRFDGLAVVGVTASLLTLVVYLSRSYRNYLDDFKAKSVEAKEEAKEEKQLKLEFHLEQARLNADAKRAREADADRLAHEERLAKIAANKEKAIAKVSSGVSSEVSSKVSNSDNQTGHLDAQKRQNQAILDAFVSNPKPNKTQLAKKLDISRQTLYDRIRVLREEGHLNGNNGSIDEA